MKCGQKSRGSRWQFVPYSLANGRISDSLFAREPLILLPLVKPILKNAAALYEAMNGALKQRVESLGTDDDNTP